MPYFRLGTTVEQTTSGATKPIRLTLLNPGENKRQLVIGQSTPPQAAMSSRRKKDNADKDRYAPFAFTFCLIAKHFLPFSRLFPKDSDKDKTIMPESDTEDEPPMPKSRRNSIELWKKAKKVRGK